MNIGNVDIDTQHTGMQSMPIASEKEKEKQIRIRRNVYT